MRTPVAAGAAARVASGGVRTRTNRAAQASSSLRAQIKDHTQANEAILMRCDLTATCDHRQCGEQGRLLRSSCIGEVPLFLVFQGVD